MEHEGLLRAHNSLHLDPVVSQMSSVYALKPRFFKVHFMLFHGLRLRRRRDVLPSGFLSRFLHEVKNIGIPLILGLYGLDISKGSNPLTLFRELYGSNLVRDTYYLSKKML